MAGTQEQGSQEFEQCPTQYGWRLPLGSDDVRMYFNLDFHGKMVTDFPAFYCAAVVISSQECCDKVMCSAYSCSPATMWKPLCLGAQAVGWWIDDADGVHEIMIFGDFLKWGYSKIIHFNRILD